MAFHAGNLIQDYAHINVKPQVGVGGRVGYGVGDLEKSFVYSSVHIVTKRKNRKRKLTLLRFDLLMQEKGAT